MIAIPTITNVMNKAKEKTFESQARMLIGAARNASIENPSKICYTLSELSNYVNKDLNGYSGSVLLDKENKVNKIWLSKNPYIINGSIEEEIEVIELAQYQEASETCEDIEILACSEDPSSYTLVINPDGGIHDGNENNEGYELTKNGTKAITEPSKVGYAFDGWEVTGTPDSFIDGLFVMGEENVVIRAKWIILYAYTGTSTLIDDGDGNWRIKFLTSGTFTPSKAMTIDVFLVGGGGSAGGETGGNTGGGGSGRVYTELGYVMIGEMPVTIVIGGGGLRPVHNTGGTQGGATSFGALSVLGGNTTLGRGKYAPGQSGAKYAGGDGGSGGADAGSTVNGTDGNDALGGGDFGKGQGVTTREFGEQSGTLYASGGKGTGGSRIAPITGIANTGNGGSGAGVIGNQEDGGSGIVVIRNHR